MGSIGGGGVRLRPCLDSRDDTVCDFPSVTGVKADEAGEESKRGKDRILLSGRRPY